MKTRRPGWQVAVNVIINLPPPGARLRSCSPEGSGTELARSPVLSLLPRSLHLHKRQLRFRKKSRHHPDSAPSSVSAVTHAFQMCPFLATSAASALHQGAPHHLQTLSRRNPAWSPAPVMLSLPASRSRVSTAQVTRCPLFCSDLSGGPTASAESMLTPPPCGLPPTTSPAASPAAPRHAGRVLALCRHGSRLWHVFPFPTDEQGSLSHPIEAFPQLPTV